MEQKLCKICGRLKNVENFFKNDRMKDGYRNECKSCLKEKEKLHKDDRKKTRQEREIKTEGNKICRACGINKSLSEYHIKKGTPDGHRHECKECVKIIQKKYKEAPGFKEKQKEYDKKRYDELREQILERKKEYHIENREEILKKKAEYRSIPENKERTKKYLGKYREEHRQEMRDYIKIYKVENRDKYYKYRRDNPHVIAWRSVLYSTLKRLNTPKEGRTIQLLGYSALDLKNHIQSLFIEGMTWDNHGEWHIDHITAVANFSQDADIKEVCALENLQPLWEFDNLSKNKY
jgi:hypothetical protein